MREYVAIEGILYLIPKRKELVYASKFMHAKETEDEDENDELAKWVQSNCKIVGEVDVMLFS